MKALFEKTVKSGYALLVGKDGPAVTSAHAPESERA